MREHIRPHGCEDRHYKETVKRAEVGRHLITYCRNQESTVLCYTVHVHCVPWSGFGLVHEEIRGKNI